MPVRLRHLTWALTNVMHMETLKSHPTDSVFSEVEHVLLGVHGTQHCFVILIIWGGSLGFSLQLVNISALSSESGINVFFMQGF